jgi:hypothetical protein
MEDRIVIFQNQVSNEIKSSFIYKVYLPLIQIWIKNEFTNGF